MTGVLEVPWLRVVPRRITLQDAAGHRHETRWLDPGDPRREQLPAYTRERLDDVEARLGPAAWGRYSWRTLIPVVGSVVFAACVIIGVGSYAMFPHRAIVALLVGVIGILPAIVLGVALGGRAWVRRTGAAARINACIAGGCCPACLAPIDSLTPEPIDTVPCACGAAWPTLGALQAGWQSIPVAVAVVRAGELAWIILFGLLTSVYSIAIPMLPFQSQLVGAASGVLIVLIFVPLISVGHPAMTFWLGVVLGAPQLLVMFWGLFRYNAINMPLLIGSATAIAICYATGRLRPTKPVRPGWDVARFVCDSCGYDLRGVSTPGAPLAACPECGAAVNAGPVPPNSPNALNPP